MELVSSARKRYIVGIDSSSVKIVGLIVSAVIPTDAKKLIAIHVATVADAVNALDGVG